MHGLVAFQIQNQDPTVLMPFCLCNNGFPKPVASGRQLLVSSVPCSIHWLPSTMLHDSYGILRKNLEMFYKKGQNYVTFPYKVKGGGGAFVNITVDQIQLSLIKILKCHHCHLNRH